MEGSVGCSSKCHDIIFLVFIFRGKMAQSFFFWGCALTKLELMYNFQVNYPGPTRPFAILEPQNPRIGDFYVLQKLFFSSLIWRKGSSGKQGWQWRLAASKSKSLCDKIQPGHLFFRKVKNLGIKVWQKKWVTCCSCSFAFLIPAKYLAGKCNVVNSMHHSAGFAFWLLLMWKWL